jgi:phospholipase/carboxylesterase
MDERHTRLADLETCLIGGPSAPKLRIVFLHGYDMRAADLTPFAHSLAIPGVGYAFPQAPTAVSATGYAWWPSVRSKSAGGHGVARDLWQEYPAGRDRARAMIRNLLEFLRAECDVPLLLAGFSQGGMLACDTVLMEDAQVDALALMSASCIASTEWNESRERLQGVAAFVSHGRGDPDLSFEAGQRLAEFLTSGGAAVTWMPFDGGHEIPFSVWRQFKRFARATLRESAEDITHAHEAH